MRASEVIEAILAAVEAIDPDDSAGRHDRFLRLDSMGQDVQTAPDRSVICRLDEPPRARDLFTEDLWQVSVALTVIYGPSANQDTRIASDTERIIVAIQGLTYGFGELAKVTVGAPALVEQQAATWMMLPIECEYRLTGV